MTNKITCVLLSMHDVENYKVLLKFPSNKEIECIVDNKDNWDTLYLLLHREFEAEIYQDENENYHLVI